MNALPQLFVKIWTFVVSPPAEVGTATIKLISDSSTCLANNLSAFAQTILDSFKGIF